MRVLPLALGRSVRCWACDEPFVVTDRPWYYQAVGKTKGPVGPEVLLLLAGQGKIGPDTLIRRMPDGRWIPASALRGLFDGRPQGGNA